MWDIPCGLVSGWDMMMGKADLDTIPLNRYGFGFFVGYPICQAFRGIYREMVYLWDDSLHEIFCALV